MTAPAQLRPRQEPARPLRLDPALPFTLGRDPASSLPLQGAGISRQHAVIRVSRTTGSWVVCDLGSVNGTFLEGERIRHCRPLAHGDEIRLGRSGPAFVFDCPSAAAAPGRTSAPAARRADPRAAGAVAGRGVAERGVAVSPVPAAVRSGERLDFEGHSLPVAEILSASVVSRPRHPQIFSWWLLACLGGLLLLPFPLIFWPLQAGALAGWVVLGSRQDHILVVTLRDGQAYRHAFASKPTALAHRDGIRRRIGASASP